MKIIARFKEKIPYEEALEDLPQAVPQGGLNAQQQALYDKKCQTIFDACMTFDRNVFPCPQVPQLTFDNGTAMDVIHQLNYPTLNAISQTVNNLWLRTMNLVNDGISAANWHNRYETTAACAVGLSGAFMAICGGLRQAGLNQGVQSVLGWFELGVPVVVTPLAGFLLYQQRVLLDEVRITQNDPLASRFVKFYYGRERAGAAMNQAAQPVAPAAQANNAIPDLLQRIADNVQGAVNNLFRRGVAAAPVRNITPRRLEEDPEPEF